MREDPGDVGPRKVFRDALERAGIESTDSQEARAYRHFSEAGHVRAPGVRVEGVELEGDAREEAVADRVRERFRDVAGEVVAGVEDVLGNPLSELAAWRAPAERFGDLSDRLGLVLEAAMDPPLEVPTSSVRGVLRAADQVGPPVLAVPRDRGARVLLLFVGRLRAVVEGVDDLLADQLEAPEADEVPEDLEALAPAEASRPRPDPDAVRVELEVLRREIGRLRLLCQLQDDLATAFDLLSGVPDSRPWEQLAGALRPDGGRPGFWCCRLPDPPAPVTVAAGVFAEARRNDLEARDHLQDGRPIGDPLAEHPVQASLVGVETGGFPFGLSVAVRDPWVPKKAVHDAVDQALDHLRETTHVPNLNADDRALLDLVQEVEEQMRAEGEWPSELDQRPPGFWSRVQERWNREHPERQLKQGSLRGWHHRVANRVEAG